LADFGICRPKWLRMIQEKPPPIGEYRNVVSVAIRNAFVFFLLIPVFTVVKDYCGYSTAPPISWFEIVWDFLKFLAPFSTWFYLWHRLVHIPPLYGWIHKKHHEYKRPIAPEGVYFTLIDFFMGNIFPIYFSQLLCVNSQWTVLLINVIAIANSFLTHGGYSIPYICDGAHDSHHEFFNINFGAGSSFMDKIFGTYLSPEDIILRRNSRKQR